MRRSIKAELLKLVTLRSTPGFLIGAIAIAIAAFALPGENIVTELEKPLHEQQSVFLIGFLLRVVLLVFGIRAITDETRHGTITPSLLAVPRRGRFLISKVFAISVAGAAIGIAVVTTIVIATTFLANANGVASTFDRSDMLTLVGTIAAAAVWPVIGVAIGTIVRSQIGATVGGLVWLMALEDALRDRLGDLAPYLPGQAGLALALGPSDRVLLRAAVTMTVYAAAAVGIAFLLFRRRDISPSD